MTRCSRNIGKNIGKTVTTDVVKTSGQARSQRVTVGVIDLTKVTTETLEKVAKVERLQADNPDLPLKVHCRRVDLSLAWFFKVRKSLRLAGGLLAPHEARGEVLNIVEG